MRLRQRFANTAVAVSVASACACALHTAYATAVALLLGAVFLYRRSRKPTKPLENLSDWLIALEGKDPFDPDVKPVYEFSGFVTTFVAVLRVKHHPTLNRETLVLFRDEIEDDQWRALVARIRHGPHTLAAMQATRWY